MIQLKVSGGNFTPIISRLDQLSHPDLMPLAIALKSVMIEDNRSGLLAGTNADGSEAAELEASTIERGRPGDGPPRVPQSESSRMISGYDVEVQVSTDRLLLIGGWRNTPFVHFHKSGTKNMAARDPVGIRPDGQIRIAEVVGEFAASLIGGRS